MCRRPRRNDPRRARRRLLCRRRPRRPFERFYRSSLRDDPNGLK